MRCFVMFVTAVCVLFLVLACFLSWENGIEVNGNGKKYQNGNGINILQPWPVEASLISGDRETWKKCFIGLVWVNLEFVYPVTASAGLVTIPYLQNEIQWLEAIDLPFLPSGDNRKRASWNEGVRLICMMNLWGNTIDWVLSGLLIYLWTFIKLKWSWNQLVKLIHHRM